MQFSGILAPLHKTFPQALGPMHFAVLQGIWGYGTAFAAPSFGAWKKPCQTTRQGGGAALAPKNQMKRFASLLILLTVLVPLLASTALAGPSYRRVETTDPARSSWQEGIGIVLALDEDRCKREYGRNWAQECMSRAYGEPGRLVRGVEITPHVDGEWRWSGWNSLRFHPRTQSGALAPATTYTISLEKADIPAAMALNVKQVTFTTQGEGVLPGKETVWIDPSANEAHGISIPLTFIWPQDTARVEKSLRLSADNGVVLANPRLAWNATNDGVVVSALVRKLGETPGRVTVHLDSMPAYTLEEGRRVLQKKPLAHAFGVPGRKSLFSFREIRLARGHDQNFNLRHELLLETTLRTSPKDLLAALTVLELPEKAEPGADEPTDWTRYPALSRDDVRKARKIEPVLLSPKEETDSIRLALAIEPERCVLVLVDKKLASQSGIHLEKDVCVVLRAPEAEAELSFLLPGNLVSLAGSRKIALHSIGIDSLRWQARRIQPSFLALFAASHGFSSKTIEPGMSDVDLDAQTVTVRGTIPVALQDNGRASFPVLELDKMLEEHPCGLYQLVLQGMRDGKMVAFAEKMVLLTNLGLVIKENALGGRHVFVASLFSGTPVGGVRVQLLARNGTAIATVQTNAQGQAYLPPAKGLEGEMEPVAIMATSTGKDPDLSWLSLRDKSRVLDMSDFAVSGRHSTKSGLMASVFSERGLYMPGDMLHFGIMVRRFDWRMLPKDLPLETVLTDPLGRTVLKKPLHGDPSLASVSWQSSPQSPTGPYRLDVRILDDKSVAPILGSATVRIEEFEPDTLALAAQLDPAPKKGWIVTRPSQSPASASIKLSTLYGDAAKGHDIRASLASSPARLSFPGFAGYTFQDISLAQGEQRTVPLPEVRTDKNGAATLALPPCHHTGTFSATLRIEGFDAAGGRAVARELKALFSPLEVIVGFRPTDGANTLDHVVQNAPAAIEVLALDNTLLPKSLEDLTLTIAQRRYVNALVRDQNGEFAYDTTALTKPFRTEKINLEKEGRKISLPTQTPGDYLLTLATDKGATILSVPYTVAGRNVVLPDGTSSVAYKKGDLNLRLNREEYEPGDTMVVRMNTPYSGTGLITIERESVVESVWFRAEAGESEQRIRIPASFEGQGYVSVLFARTTNSETIYISPMVHATLPFVCGLGQRSMGLELEAQSEVQPGRDIPVRVHSQRKGRALLFAVDEGILSLTGYTTPDPLRELLSNRALDVTTWQIFDLLMPDHARLKGRLPAFGGDMATPGGRFLNPFRRRNEPPFARWLGLVDVDQKGTVVSIRVPEYLSGSIRIMAVGTSSVPGGFLSAGSAEVSCRVRGSLILRPFLPLAANPGDRIKAACAIANTIPGSGSNVPINVRITARDGLELLEDGKVVPEISQTLAIDENTEKTLSFDLQVADRLGAGSLLFEANLAKPAPDQVDRGFARRLQQVSICPLDVARTTSKYGRLEKNVPVLVDRILYPLDADTRLVVSAAPLTSLRALSARLASYPYGCAEQRISQAFPWLAARFRPEIADLVNPSPDLKERNEAMEKAIEAALATIRQNLAGQTVSLWPGGEGNEELTVYASDFLVSLAEYGSSVPADLRETLLSSLKSLVWRDPQSLADARTRAYACWVLMRSGELVTQDVERLTIWLDSYAKGWRKDVTAALLADCYAMLRLESEATNLMPQSLAPIERDGSGLFDTTCAMALHATILARPHWQGDKASPHALFEEVATRALAPNATTMACALASRALANAIAGLEAQESISDTCKITCEERMEGFASGEGEIERTLAGMHELSAPGCRKFAVTAKQPARLVWNLSVTGYDRGVPASSANGIEVKRRYLDSSGREVTEAKAGDVVTVEIGLRSDRSLDNVVLCDLLPGGLEPQLAQGEQLPWYVDHVERREDRMLFFMSTAGDMRLVTYRARATTAGTFSVPVVHAEAMYQPDMEASTAGGKLHIVKR